MLTSVRRLVRSAERIRDFVGFVRDPLAALTHTMRTRGDVAALPVPGPRLIQVSHPEHVSVLLRMPHRDTLATKSLRDLLGNGLITTAADDVRARRRLVGRPLTPKTIATYVDDMREQTARWADAFCAAHTGEAAEITSGLFALSMDVLLRSALGSHISLDRPRFAALLDAYMYEFYLDNTGWRRLLPPSLVTPGRRRRSAAVQGMQEMVQQSIEQRRRAAPANDILYVLMNAQGDDGELLSDSDLLDELLTMLIPGHETPALMLGYALWALAAHPDIQRRLHEELAAFDVLDAAAIQACRFLGAVVDESFRLYPPAYVIGREAREAMELDGVAIAAGDQLIAPQWVVHRDPRWWRAPEQFRPERWLNGETSELAPGTFFPFGGGQRSCLGGHFSRLMGQVVLGQLVKQMEVALDPSYSLSFIQGPTLRPREGIRVRIAARPKHARSQAEVRSVC